MCAKSKLKLRDTRGSRFIFHQCVPIQERRKTGKEKKSISFDIDHPLGR